MSTETNTNSIKDHMARLRLKMVQQKIANEKDKLMNRPGTEESTSNDLENQARLQQAMLRRQELLDKIRREQLLNDEAKRPRSYSERRRYTPSPLPVPPSRRSLPDFNRFHYYNPGPETNRSKADVSQVKHVIEHKIKSPVPRLPPIAHPTPRPLPPPPGVIIQPPPPPQIMQQPAPQIIQSPPQHVIQQIPQPIVQNLTGQPPESKSMFNKADFGEMMMMQNAQMHQMVMQKLMLGQLNHHDAYFGELMLMQNAELHQLVMQQLLLNGLGGMSGLGGGKRSSSSRHRKGSACSSSSRHGCGPPQCGPPPCGPPPPPCPPPPAPPPPCGPAPYPCAPCVPRSSGVVHHHYSSPPPSQPPVHHYTTMPEMRPSIRGESISTQLVPEYTYQYQPYYEYYQ